MKHWLSVPLCRVEFVLKSVFLTLVVLCVISGVCLAQSAVHSSANGENINELLTPLQTLHDDLSRIEAKLNSFANAKWEYKILVPNVLGNSGHDYHKSALGPLGAEGWELITYSPDVGYILKRRILPKP